MVEDKAGAMLRRMDMYFYELIGIPIDHPERLSSMEPQHPVRTQFSHTRKHFGYAMHFSERDYDAKSFRCEENSNERNANIQHAVSAIHEEVSRVEAVLAIDQLQTLQNELKTMKNLVQAQKDQIKHLKKEVKEKDEALSIMKLEKDLSEADIDAIRSFWSECPCTSSPSCRMFSKRRNTEDSSDGNKSHLSEGRSRLRRNASKEKREGLTFCSTEVSSSYESLFPPGVRAYSRNRRTKGQAGSKRHKLNLQSFPQSSSVVSTCGSSQESTKEVRKCSEKFLIPPHPAVLQRPRPQRDPRSKSKAALLLDRITTKALTKELPKSSDKSTLVSRNSSTETSTQLSDQPNGSAALSSFSSEIASKRILFRDNPLPRSSNNPYILSPLQFDSSKAPARSSSRFNCEKFADHSRDRGAVLLCRRRKDNTSKHANCSEGYQLPKDTRNRKREDEESQSLQEQVQVLAKRLRDTTEASDDLRLRLAMISRYYKTTVHRLHEKIAAMKAAQATMQIDLTRQINAIDRERLLAIK